MMQMSLTVKYLYHGRRRKLATWLLVGISIGIGSSLVSCRTRELTQTGPELASRQDSLLFTQHCAACHGSDGRGDGPAQIALTVPPRDFWNEPFRYISSLEPIPTDDDLIQTIRAGRRLGEMPANPYLTDAQVLALVNFVRELNRQGWIDRLTQETEEDDEMTADEIEEIATERVTPGKPILVSLPGPGFRRDTAVGRKLYMAACASCHGPAGRGDGLEKPLDEQGRPIRVRDLTSGQFRGGTALNEIFKRIRCGVPGTPMPVQDTMTDEQVWQLVYYVRFLAGQLR